MANIPPIPGTHGNPVAEASPEVHSLEDDLKTLESLKLSAEMLKRFRYGKHPVPNIEALFQRRLNLQHQDFLGPFPVRIACTLAFIVASCGTIWLVLWAFFSLLHCTNFLLELSMLLTFFFVALLALGASNPLRIYDESLLQKNISLSLQLLREEKSNPPEKS
ncbi:MAG: hypothetical protein HQM08_09425 [Candidatus Riflebacteria bacterium]|nr:hypothetical protein [Candidatus Riflebacteria bacterium]